VLDVVREVVYFLSLPCLCRDKKDAYKLVMLGSLVVDCRVLFIVIIGFCNMRESRSTYKSMVSGSSLMSL
jgi:hypothetical protein